LRRNADAVLDKEQKWNMMHTSSDREDRMLARFAEDAAALASMGVFLAMIAVWGGFVTGF